MTKQNIIIFSSVSIALVIGGGIWYLRGRVVDDVAVTIPSIKSPAVSTSTVQNPVIDVNDASESIIDKDKDGLSDSREAEIGTDPEKFDTDGDGKGDYEENAQGTDPKNASSVAKDSRLPAMGYIPDVLPTSTQATTSAPISALDTDRDTIPDTKEPDYGTDPKKADTDGDGYTDADEIKNGYNPLGSGRCQHSTCLIK